MTIDEIIRKQIEAMNRHDAAAAAALYATDAVVTDPQYPEPLRGTAAITKDLTDLFTAFPDLRVELGKTIANGESYAVDFVMSGTHDGPIVGLSGHIPATGKTVRFGGAVLSRLGKDGRVVEERRYLDYAGMLAQLGLLQ
jgi:steroid delta-isomerase-like uncharacterized protein